MKDRHPYLLCMQFSKRMISVVVDDDEMGAQCVGHRHTEDIERLSYYLHLIRIEEHSYCSFFFHFRLIVRQMTRERASPYTMQ